MPTADGLHVNIFDRIAKRIAHLTGHPAIFAVACLAIVLWGALGPALGYSDTWQLVIDTSTTSPEEAATLIAAACI